MRLTPDCEIVPFELIRIFPETVVVFVMVKVDATVPPIVNDLHVAVAVIEGCLTPP